MSAGGKRRHGRQHGIVIGACYVCRGPCTRDDSTRVKDAAVGVRRLVHRGACADRFAVVSTPTIEGGNDG